MGSDTSTNALREIRGVMGFHDSDIDDTDERDALLRAVECGDTTRESHGGATDDFVRIIAYCVPGTHTTRYALHFHQSDGLEYIHDSDDPDAVQAAYQEEVRNLSACGWTWADSDVPGARLDGENAELLNDERA